MIVVTLTYPEICLGAHVAIMRRVQNMKWQTRKRFGSDEGEAVWQTDVMSCFGEMALAKHLKRFWSGAIGDYEAADVGDFYEVRATHWQNGRLILHPDDPDGAPHTLARVTDNKVTLVGWAWGHEGKRQEYWTTLPAHPTKPAFFVPNEILHDMTDLPPEPT